MQKKIMGFALAAALFAGPALAQDKKSIDVTATAAIVSDYSFRGISQSDNNPALQLGVEGAMKVNDYFTGYVSLWGSNVDFVPNVDDGAHAEVDVTVGFRGAVAGIGYDAKYILYNYPGATASLNYDYREVAGSLNYDFGFVIPTVGINYSTNNFGNSGTATYYYAGVKVPLSFIPYDTRILANIGKQNIEKNATFGTPDYKDWNVGLYATFFGVDVGVQYVDTDLKDSECFGGGAAKDLCSARAILSVGYTYAF